MKQRAFVVMPYGTREIAADKQWNPFAKSISVDFNRVYSELIEPALAIAGCEAFRADEEPSAGDIRTDMFFELVTADVVVADLSIPNPNVYYELGIRDGVCPRGVFIVEGGWSAPRPFDVAEDRSFKYDGKLFSLETGETADLTDEDKKSIHHAVNELATIFTRALASEVQGTGSPVYSHLPGLKPANWDDIETSRARYFGALQRDWQERVRRAQELNLPGHIITIAQDAPTRIHRTKILWEAARALIGLCKYAAAAEVFNEILQLKPDDVDAQLYLGIAHALSGDTQGAQNQLQSVLQQHENDPKVGLSMGFVYRLLWFLQWRDDPDPQVRAKKSDRLLLLSVRSFYKVQSDHPEQFLGGYNALLLLAVAEKLFGEIKLPTLMFDRAEFATVVRYTANAARQVAEETGDYDSQFWSAVALAGLELLQGNKEGTVRGIADACAVPFRTLFYLQLLKERLVFLKLLNFQTEIINAVMDTVDAAMQATPDQKHWGKVVVYHGFACDEINAPSTCFPRSGLEGLHQHIAQTLQQWEVGKGDLAICAAATEGDVLFAEACLDLQANVRLLILEPRPDQLAEPFTDPFRSEWVNRATALADRPDTEVWYHRAELGEPADTTYLQGRHNRWILNTARMEAEHTATVRDETGVEHPAGVTDNARLYGLILSDSKAASASLEVTNPEAPSFFISEIRASARYQGRVQVIDVRQLGE